MVEAVTTVKRSKTQTIAMVISFLLALPLAAVLLVHPAMMLDANGHYNHSVLMLVMLGISGGFIHGVGYIPQFWLWKWLFSPYIAWPLMLIGYYLWFVK
ncbi:cytochrome bd biosynthesis protein [Acinetobacter guerrae]|uniref:Cytochrome bd biosynthesis protein n=1 Tax=Acinetobacter guerrae TaxID=1843371 RepID=A0A3A8ERX3_9GAMM|nr:cyd operon YbgE family protein [Acinetobacter guerrae]MPW43099.1 cytochrome bd biosynthesis protein [Acinetobacter guerrae]RKG32714.1 cytochrome bd biosynthesis protein [Acinetobacter guerrae]